MHVKIIKNVITIGDKDSFKYNIEIITKRNDKWLVSHPRHFLESWQANLDYQLVVDYDKVFDYMTKCVTKTETSITKGIASMIRKLLVTAVENGNNVQSVLKRAMDKLLGERMISKQETTHLILQKPLVSCSHRFMNVNLEDTYNRLNFEP